MAGDGGVKALEHPVARRPARRVRGRRRGPSGCGKSTLMKLATGLHRAQMGSVPGQRREEVTKPLKIAGMAFQNPVMLPWRRTVDNVLIPMEVVEPHRKRIRFHRAEYKEKARGAAGDGGARGLRRSLSLAALGRHAAARIAVPRAHPRAGLADARRAPSARSTPSPARSCGACCATSTRRAASPASSSRTTCARPSSLADRVHVLSNRPARVIDTMEVPFERPSRRLSVTYEKDFAAIVGHLRSEIADARAVPAASVAAA